MIRVPVLSLALCLAAWPAGAQVTISSCGTGPGVAPCDVTRSADDGMGAIVAVFLGFLIGGVPLGAVVWFTRPKP